MNIFIIISVLFLATDISHKKIDPEAVSVPSNIVGAP